jgi:hypothetical protein
VVDRVYRKYIPEFKKALEGLRREFAAIDSRTDWAKLRVEPLLRHTQLLERQLRAQGSERLKMGVRMFHSDLVYLQENVKGLKSVLATEKERVQAKIKQVRKRRS